jgi:hypothetical protein
MRAEEKLVCGADATPDTTRCPYTHRRQFKWGFIGDSICKEIEEFVQAPPRKRR